MAKILTGSVAKSVFRLSVGFILLGVMSVTLACAPGRQATVATHPTAKSAKASYPVKPKAMVTPWQYYQSARTAELKSEDNVELQKAEFRTAGGDTKKDKTGIILIGTLVGVLVVGGAVSAILLTR